VLRVAGELAHTSRGSEEGFGHPRRPAPKGGGAGLAGVWAPVQWCVPETRNDGKKMLTTRRKAGCVGAEYGPDTNQ
jgi:hypothetical protein